MPGVPMLMPSETVMVPKMIALPPAAFAPASASRASLSMCMLQGVTMLHVEAMPMMGFLKSSSVKPTGRSIERAPARLGPSVTTEENLRVELEAELMAKIRRSRPEGGRTRNQRVVHDRDSGRHKFRLPAPVAAPSLDANSRMAFNLKKVLKALLLSSSQPLAIKDIQAAFTRFHETASALPLETPGDGAPAAGDDSKPAAGAAAPAEGAAPEAPAEAV